jgi:hypothetical protein
VQNGEVKLISISNPEQALLDTNGQALTLKTLVEQSIGGIGFSPKPKSLETEPVIDPTTGGTAWTDGRGNKHLKMGNTEYIYHQHQPDPLAGLSGRERELARIQQIRDEALNMD